MTEAHAAVGMDRLPWLTDEPRARATDGSRDLLGWVIAATILVAGASYWMGMNSARPPAAPSAIGQGRQQATVTLPQARPAAPAEPQASVVAPEAESMAAAPASAVEPRPKAVRKARAKAVNRAKPSKKGAATHKAKPKAVARKASGPPVWPVRVVDGTTGRMVRIGTFATPRQAKKGWWAVMRAYPGMQRLPALVVPVQSYRNGRIYYRLQMGTTSQAHSEVLCQRMRIIGQSCVVIGLNRRQVRT